MKCQDCGRVSTTETHICRRRAPAPIPVPEPPRAGDGKCHRCDEFFDRCECDGDDHRCETHCETIAALKAEVATLRSATSEARSLLAFVGLGDDGLAWKARRVIEAIDAALGTAVVP